MNDLRKVAEQALKQLQRDDVYLGHRSKTRADAITALRQALDLQTTIEKGTKAWADVSNASAWVEELRGNDTPEVTPEVDKAYTKLDSSDRVLHKEWVEMTDEQLEKELPAEAFGELAECWKKRF